MCGFHICVWILFHVDIFVGLVKKLPNHKEDFGMTDALCCHGDILYTSAYDLDTGQGYMNGKFKWSEH